MKKEEEEDEDEKQELEFAEGFRRINQFIQEMNYLYLKVRITKKLELNDIQTGDNLLICSPTTYVSQRKKSRSQTGNLSNSFQAKHDHLLEILRQI